MLTLAIDSSDRHFSLALLSDSRIVAEFDSKTELSRSNSPRPNSPRGFPPGVSVQLYPALRELLAKAKCQLSDLGLLAVATGPGMFTGLRVGVVTAKTLAYVHGTPLIGVNTLEVIAHRAVVEIEWDTPPLTIKPVLNAQRQQLFSGAYEVQSIETAEFSELTPNRIIDREQWMAELEPGDVVTGSGIKPMIDQLQLLPMVQEKKISVYPSSVWECTALGVGLIGEQRFAAGQRDDLWTLEPFYFRPSYAEES